MNKKEQFKSNELLYLYLWYKETRLETTLITTLLGFFSCIALALSIVSHNSKLHEAVSYSGYVISAVLLTVTVIKTMTLQRFKWPDTPELLTKTLPLSGSQTNDGEGEVQLTSYLDDENLLILPPHWKRSIPSGLDLQNAEDISILAAPLNQFYPDDKAVKAHRDYDLLLGYPQRPIIHREWMQGLSQWKSTFARGMIFAQVALLGALTFTPLLLQGSTQNAAIISRLIYVYTTLILIVLFNFSLAALRNRRLSNKLAAHWDDNSALSTEDSTPPETQAEKNPFEQILRQLIAEKRTIAVAESLTGGTIQKQITAASGVSAIFQGGLTTYTLDTKTKLLGVDKAHASATNCVSEQVVREMATGAAELFQADITLATTGYAEKPDHPSAELNTPYAYIAVKTESNLKVVRIARPIEENRAQVQLAVSDAVAELLKSTLAGPTAATDSKNRRKENIEEAKNEANLKNEEAENGVNIVVKETIVSANSDIASETSPKEKPNNRLPDLDLDVDFDEQF